jgi:hypothetical protein
MLETCFVNLCINQFYVMCNDLAYHVFSFLIIRSGREMARLANGGSRCRCLSHVCKLYMKGDRF